MTQAFVKTHIPKYEVKSFPCVPESSSVRSNQQMGDSMSNSIWDSSVGSELVEQKNKTSSLSHVTGLFVGFSPKSSESDSVRSPTSPLDFWVFTNLANPFVRSPKSPRMPWGSSKVGLSIIESLDDINAKQSSGFPKIVTKPPFFHKSIDALDAPKSLLITRTQVEQSNLQKGTSDAVFGIGENPFEAESIENFRSCSLDSGRSRLTNFSINSSFESFGSKTRMSPLGSNPKLLSETQALGDSSSVKVSPFLNLVSLPLEFIGSLSASEIELSEDYTCVKKFGPNPKTTHIFSDIVLECHNRRVTKLSDIEDQKVQLVAPNPFPPLDFLNQCYLCIKKLEGRDIYMYRGEKAFCSPECRSYEISIDEKEEKGCDASSKSFSKPNNCKESQSFWFIG